MPQHTTRPQAEHPARPPSAPEDFERSSLAFFSRIRIPPRATHAELGAQDRTGHDLVSGPIEVETEAGSQPNIDP